MVAVPGFLECWADRVRACLPAHVRFERANDSGRHAGRSTVRRRAGGSARARRIRSPRFIRLTGRFRIGCANRLRAPRTGPRLRQRTRRRRFQPATGVGPRSDRRRRPQPWSRPRRTRLRPAVPDLAPVPGRARPPDCGAPASRPTAASRNQPRDRPTLEAHRARRVGAVPSLPSRPSVGSVGAAVRPFSLGPLHSGHRSRSGAVARDDSAHATGPCPASLRNLARQEARLWPRSGADRRNGRGLPKVEEPMPRAADRAGPVCRIAARRDGCRRMTRECRPASPGECAKTAACARRELGPSPSDERTTGADAERAREPGPGNLPCGPIPEPGISGPRLPGRYARSGSRAPWSVRRATCSVRRATCSVRRATCSVRRATCSVR